MPVSSEGAGLGYVSTASIEGLGTARLAFVERIPGRWLSDC